MPIKDKLKNLTTSPGIYKFLDKKGKVIYIGKAKNLKNRVKNYFQKSTQHGPKNQKLVENTVDLEWVETNTEQEAIILETNFIKELRPKYNILMKDDKNFVYIKVTLNEAFPRILIVRQMEKDGAKYFGPKTSKTQVEKTLKLLTKIFPFRDCNYEIQEENGEIVVKGAARNLPCLQYHIKKCLGPCIGKVSQTDYRKIIEKIVLFLKGNTAEIESQIKAEMQVAAAERKFERAGKLRDNLFAVQNITDKQYISEANFEERDVFGFVQDLGKTFFTLLQIRDGKMIGQEQFIVEGESLDEEGETQVLNAFLEQYYTVATDIPGEILLPISLGGAVSPELRAVSEKVPLEKGEACCKDTGGLRPQKKQQIPQSPFQSGVLKSFLSELSGKNVKLLVPQKGKKNALIALAEKNALSYAKANRLKWMEERTIDNEKLLDELTEILEAEKKIHRMECYDISHLGGTDTVGSMVVFQNGKPKNSDYRHFKLRSLEEGKIDDFKAMNEVLERRLKYLAFDDKKELLGDEYKIRRGKKADLDFIEKTAKKAGLDIDNLDVKDFLVLEKTPLRGQGGVGATEVKSEKLTVESNQVDIGQETNNKTLRFKSETLNQQKESVILTSSEARKSPESKPTDLKNIGADSGQARMTIKGEKKLSIPNSPHSTTEIVGFVRIKNHSDKVKEIGTLWIQKQERHQGFGSLLCRELIRKSKLAKIYCHTYLDFVPFCAQFGFQEIYQIPKEIEARIKRKKLKNANYKCLAYLKSRQENVDKSFGSKPDLIVIDGGKGQLGMAQKALNEFNLQIPLISLAKKEEEIFISGQKEPIPVKANSEISFLIQRIRDESHRFAVTFNRELRSKRMVQSKLDEIIGLGPKMKQKLLQRFGSVEGIQNAGDGELIGVVGKSLLGKLRREL